MGFPCSGYCFLLGTCSVWVFAVLFAVVLSVGSFIVGCCFLVTSLYCNGVGTGVANGGDSLVYCVWCIRSAMVMVWLLIVQ